MLSLDLLQSTLVCAMDLRYLGRIFLLFILFIVGFMLKTMLVPTYLRSLDKDLLLWASLLLYSGNISLEPLISLECSHDLSLDSFLDTLFTRNLLGLTSLSFWDSLECSLFNPMDSLEDTKWDTLMYGFYGCRTEDESMLLYSRLSSGLEFALELHRERDSRWGMKMWLLSSFLTGYSWLLATGAWMGL